MALSPLTFRAQVQTPGRHEACPGAKPKPQRPFVCTKNSTVHASLIRFAADLRLLPLLLRSQKSYLACVRHLAEHYGKAPEEVSPKELRQYFLYLKTERRFSRSISTQAIYALKMFWEQSLRRYWRFHCHPLLLFPNVGRGSTDLAEVAARMHTAIGDALIRSVTDLHVAFTWKDRAHGNVIQTETVTGVEFVARYLRHVLPRGLKAVLHYGFCHPSAQATRQRIAFHTGMPLRVGATVVELSPVSPPSTSTPTCPCCVQPMKCLLRVLPAWRSARGPPQNPPLAAIR